MRRPTVLIFFAIALLACERIQNSTNQKPSVATTTRENRQYTQETVKLDRPSPNVDLTSYVLITNDPETDRGQAQAIMRVRGSLPLAVQTKDRVLFNRILAKGFTFRAADEFWNREEYIRNRVETDETVGPAKYENLVLQFFGNIAVSTYRNAIKLRDATGKEGTLYMSWASVYLKEGDEWKIGAIHLVDKKSVR
jgi:hypothetical protein